MHLTWLGQSGFLLENNGFTIALDPYLSTIVEDIKEYQRLMPPVMPRDDLRPDILFCSHNHFDHFDPVTIKTVIKNCPECRIYGPSCVPERAKTRNLLIPGFTCLKPGQSFSAGEFDCKVLPARHSDPEAIGLLVTIGDIRIYFSGDTLYYPELSKEIQAIASEPIDLALLCINGQGGNMSSEEAAQLAQELDVNIAIPTHYGMFAENTVKPDEFCSFCYKDKIKTTVLVPGLKNQLSKVKSELFIEKCCKTENL